MQHDAFDQIEGALTKRNETSPNVNEIDAADTGVDYCKQFQIHSAACWDAAH